MLRPLRSPADVARTVRAGHLDSIAPSDLAWLLLAPAALAALLIVFALAPLAGDVLFPRPPFHYWDTGPVVRKPAVQAGYLMIVALAVAYAVGIVVAGRGGARISRPRVRPLVLASQAAALAFLLACWIAQRHIEVTGITRVYFKLPTLLVAAAFVAATCAALRWRGGAPLRRIAARAKARSRLLLVVCLGLALLGTAVWLLPAVYTDRGIARGPGELFGNAYAFDEASAVLDHRSPLVDMVAYGTLWPYLLAPLLWAFGGSYLAFTLTMVSLSGLGLLAVYAILRRITRSAPLALALYVPCVATGFFIERDEFISRYDPGNYFGVFPLRYAGPYLLAWLVVRYVDPERTRRFPPELLFLAAGLVALNNIDFGVAALGGTVLAVLSARRFGESLRRLARGAAVGLGGALALVSLLTLLRAGSLPHLGLLLRYGHIFVDGGYGNVALPALGFHTVITLTFVGALAVAAVRVATREEDVVLTAMLAWMGLFGLGASVYYYAYRSHPDVLVNLFSMWSVTVTLLVVVTLRAMSRSRGRPPAAGLVVLFCFGLAACSVAQLPGIGDQVRRITVRTPVQPFRLPLMRDIVAEQTHRGERVVVYAPVGHRVAHDAGVVDVDPYTGLGQMPSKEQFDEVLAVLRREGGTKVFLGETQAFDVGAALTRRGYALVRMWEDGTGWTGLPVREFQRR